MSKDFFEFDVLSTNCLSDLANVKLPDPTLLDYYKRLEDRCILWNTGIGGLKLQETGLWERTFSAG